MAISNIDRMALLKEEMKLLRKQQKEEKQKKVENLIFMIGQSLVEQSGINAKKEEEISSLLYYIKNIENKPEGFVFDKTKFEKHLDKKPTPRKTTNTTIKPQQKNEWYWLVALFLWVPFYR